VAHAVDEVADPHVALWRVRLVQHSVLAAAVDHRHLEPAEPFV
jgi:hypothetical protein